MRLTIVTVVYPANFGVGSKPMSQGGLDPTFQQDGVSTRGGDPGIKPYQVGVPRERKDDGAQECVFQLQYVGFSSDHWPK